jgi:hypothetical protein
MNEQQWRNSVEPERMLEFLRDVDDGRRSMRVAVAACRRIWPLLTDARSRRVVEIVDLYSQGRASEQEFVDAGKQAEIAYRARKQEETAIHVGDDLAVRALAEPKSLFALLDPDRAREVQNAVENAPAVLAASAVWSATTTESELANTGLSRIDATICVLAQAAAATDDLKAEEAAQARIVREVFKDVFPL